MLDLRLPVGIFFFIVGSILTVHGLVAPTPVEGYILDLDWGACLVVFGAVMTFYGRQGQKEEDEHEKPAQTRPAPEVPKRR